jgi:hypothetical protein
MVSRVFLPGLFKWTRWVLGYPLHPSSSHDVPEDRRDEARRQGAIGGGGEAMQAQATHGDQEDHPHLLRRACPDRTNRISPPRQGGEGLYSRSEVARHPRHEEEALQGDVARA